MKKPLLMLALCTGLFFSCKKDTSSADKFNEEARKDVLLPLRTALGIRSIYKVKDSSNFVTLKINAEEVVFGGRKINLNNSLIALHAEKDALMIDSRKPNGSSYKLESSSKSSNFTLKSYSKDNKLLTGTTVFSKNETTYIRINSDENSDTKGTVVLSERVNNTSIINKTNTQGKQSYTYYNTPYTFSFNGIEDLEGGNINSPAYVEYLCMLAAINAYNSDPATSSYNSVNAPPYYGPYTVSLPPNTFYGYVIEFGFTDIEAISKLHDHQRETGTKSKLKQYNCDLLGENNNCVWERTFCFAIATYKCQKP